MSQPEAIGFQTVACVKEPHETEADLQARWADAESKVRMLAPVSDLDAQVRPLSPAARVVAEEVARQPVFSTTFGAAPPEFINFRLDVLLSAQKYVDVEHAETVQVPREEDEAAVLSFCMRSNPIDPPLMGPDGGIAFSSHYSQNLVPSGLAFRTVSDHAVEVVATIISRPNFVQVARFNGRYIVANGYHRAVALIKAGHTRMPCLLRDVPSIEAAGLVPPGFFDLGRLFAPRPPLVSDFLSANATTLKLRARNHILRVGFQVMNFEAPR